MMNKHNKFIYVTGVSGAGKDYIVDKIKNLFPDIEILHIGSEIRKYLIEFSFGPADIKMNEVRKYADNIDLKESIKWILS